MVVIGFGMRPGYLITSYWCQKYMPDNLVSFQNHVIGLFHTFPYFTNEISSEYGQAVTIIVEVMPLSFTCPVQEDMYLKIHLFVCFQQVVPSHTFVWIY